MNKEVRMVVVALVAILLGIFMLDKLSDGLARTFYLSECYSETHDMGFCQETFMHSQAYR